MSQDIGEKTTAVDDGPILHKVLDAEDPALAQAEDLVAAETQYTKAEYDRLKRKFEFILLPIMMLVYGLQYADKVSLSSGVVFGLKPDTGLTTSEYSLLTVWFYVAYLVGQIPMMYILQRVPLGKGLGVAIVLWGIAVICLGACNNYAQLSGVRIVLGWFECCITPGFLLITISWWKRQEATLRSSMFFAMNSFLGGVFAVIIYALARHSQLHGGVAGWRAINFFLGSLTVFAGILTFIFVGVPDEVWWLNKEKKKMVRARIVGNGTGGGESHPWKWSQVRECFRDPQWYFMIVYQLLSTIPNGALGTFSVLVYQSFGFTALQSILYQLPANAIGFVVIISSALLVNKYPRARYPIALLWITVEMIVFLYIGLGKGSKWGNWACFSFNGVVACANFLLWPLMSINSAGRTKKSFMSACTFITYCVGNMIGSQTFRPNDAPRYLHGLMASAILMAAELVWLCVWWYYYRWTNKKRDAAAAAAGLTQEEIDHANRLAGETDQTDLQNPHFRYMY
ncbi:uncharacterized protein L199_004822 [Kwoniella botswanensis]|uniref:uncharacterized protein n=1 Tax=Kwoniella botswanensis TaxID=1268659 RepID=UPI00315D0027